MSDSRLEKFIYAICSMDVNDLPVPLSRIEKLWNCLITGETPDFEPLSRNEKYLMAMLDRYDISNLPAPMSRGEKLLYKIAVGETDLSDVPGYLSRYEELLKYLIENGEINEDDFEYVLYTLNQSLSTLYTTAEKPVKSAILKGCTLVNVFQDMDYVWNNLTKQDNFNYDNEDLIILNNGNPDGRYWNTLPKIPNIKSNTEYTMIFTKSGSPRVEFGTIDENGQPSALKRFTNAQKVKITSPNNGDLRVKFCIGNPSSEESPINLGKVMLIEGDYTNIDVPYFEGMQSVKMPVLTTTGKNLFDKTKITFDRLIDNHTGNIITDSFTNMTDFIKVIPNTQYTMSFNFTTNAWTRCFGLTKPKEGKYVTDANGISDKCYFDTASKTVTFTTSPTTNYLLFSFGKGVEETFQLEKGATATTYEPFKLIILDRMPVLTTIGENIIGECINPTETKKQYKAYLKPNTDYTLSYKNTDGGSTGAGKVYLKNGDTEIASYGYKHQLNFTTPSTTNSETLLCINSRVVDISVLLIEGKVSYTDLNLETILKNPYKSNILTVNEDVTLRGIGDVRDTLDLLTGEVTERIGEIVLNGSENWSRFSENRFHLKIDNWKLSSTITTNAKADKINVVPYSQYQSSSLPNISRYNGDNYGIFLYTGGSGWCEDDVTSLKTKLQSNPITVQYELTTGSIKTVDLAVVDQDNQPTELGTFENITHVSLEAENLIPEVEMEVATRISEELASASPLMDDISTKQERLNTTIDEQSENVDATMIATTEIYEETL